MKHIFLIFSLAFSLHFTVNAQGIDFFHGEWEDALTQAAEQDKLIFVDAYAQWCGPCKRMAAEVFPQEEVGAFFNRNFISVKMDMEAPENATFVSQYPVAAYPTLFFIDAKGEVVQRTKGAMQANALIGAGQKALALSEPSEDYAKAYEEGDRDPDLMYKYVRSLIRNQESHLKIANDYLRTQSDLNSPKNLQFIMLVATDSDSRIYDMMTDRKDAIIASTSEEMYYSQVKAACQSTADKAVEFSSPELLDEAWSNMKEHYPDQYKEFEIKTQLTYALAHRDSKTYAKAARDYAKFVIPEEGKSLKDFALKAFNAFSQDKRVAEVAEDIAKEALRFEEAYDYYYTLAVIQKSLDKNKDALEAARKALVLAEESAKRAVPMLQSFIDKLESAG